MKPTVAECPKCGSKDWDGPHYKSTVGSANAREWLEFLCGLCRYPLQVPCADAPRTALDFAKEIPA